MTAQDSATLIGLLAGTAGVPRFAQTAVGLFVMGRGQSNSQASDPVNGSIDDVEVFDRALDADQVASLYERSSVDRG